MFVFTPQTTDWSLIRLTLIQWSQKNLLRSITSVYSQKDNSMIYITGIYIRRGKKQYNADHIPDVQVKLQHKEQQGTYILFGKIDCKQWHTLCRFRVAELRKFHVKLPEVFFFLLRRHNFCPASG